MVVDQEDGQVAKAWIAEVTESQHFAPHRLTIHANRGSSMTSKPVAALLSDLKIGRTLSRPMCDNDNPFSESQFRTIKYRPDFPDRFGSYEDGHATVPDFSIGITTIIVIRALGFIPQPTCTTAEPKPSANNAGSSFSTPMASIPSDSSARSRPHRSSRPSQGSINPKRRLRHTTSMKKPFQKG
jgi:transposase InsO family protein